MKHITNHIAYLVAIIGMCFTLNSLAADTHETEAISSAQQWLTLIDEDNYSDSWESAATYFKNAISKDDWAKSLTAVRKPLGKLISRKLKSSTYTKSLPGAPDGEYVVIQFDTSFENKKTAIETVTPMLDGDGAWRVSGYYIK